MAWTMAVRPFLLGTCRICFTRHQGLFLQNHMCHACWVPTIMQGRAVVDRIKHDDWRHWIDDRCRDRNRSSQTGASCRSGHVTGRVGLRLGDQCMTSHPHKMQSGMRTKRDKINRLKVTCDVFIWLNWNVVIIDLIDIYQHNAVYTAGFWATVCKMVRPMLSGRCLSCPVCLSVCPVCNVRALWPNGWMDQEETWHAGRPQPRTHC